MTTAEKKEEASPRPSLDLTTLSGVVIQQRSAAAEAVAQALSLPIEVRNEYIVKALPENANVVASDKSPNLWKPTFEEIQALPELFVLKEESDCLTRVLFTLFGCRGLRPLDMRVLENEQETMRIHKPCKCGGWICCPLEMTLADYNGNKVGHVKENFDPYGSKCFECCLCCSFYHNVYTGAPTTAPTSNTMDRDTKNEEPKYELKFHLCCLQGESNNCCGATCCNHNAIFDVRDPASGKVVSNVQMMYAPSPDTTCAAFCRMWFGFDIFAIKFPEGSSHEERMMVIAAVMQAEFSMFETDQ